MSLDPVKPKFRLPPQEVAENTWVIQQMQDAVILPLWVYFNSMVIKGKEPIIVDTGTPSNREQWLADVFSLVDPDEVRWIFLSHDDIDHTGNLAEVLEACSNATLISSWFLIERYACALNIPLERCRWINDGDSWHAGDRTFTAITPPLFDSPVTRGLYDDRTRVLWSADCFANAVPGPMNDVSQMDEATWLRGLQMFNCMNSPWFKLLDPAKFARHVDRTQKLGIDLVAGCHTPSIQGSKIQDAFEFLRSIHLHDAPPQPTNTDLHDLLHALATGQQYIWSPPHPPQAAGGAPHEMEIEIATAGQSARSGETAPYSSISTHQLDEAAREGARRILMLAIEEEVAARLSRAQQATRSLPEVPGDARPHAGLDSHPRSNGMKLYMHPVSTAARPVLLFLAEENIQCESVVVDLMTGEQYQKPFTGINPNSLVPVLVEDDGFVLTESSAILKYLADKYNSPTYPKDLRARARVNELLDWFNSNLYREYGFHIIYPQIFPQFSLGSDEMNQALIQFGLKNAARFIKVLNDHWLTHGRFLTGDTVSIADYFGASILTSGDVIGNRLDGYPKVNAWLQRMRDLPTWSQIHEAHRGMAASMAGKPFTRFGA